MKMINIEINSKKQKILNKKINNYLKNYQNKKNNLIICKQLMII